MVKHEEKNNYHKIQDSDYLEWNDGGVIGKRHTVGVGAPKMLTVFCFISYVLVAQVFVLLFFKPGLRNNTLLFVCYFLH